jgi:membrane protease YdiL (CAAX protease family)
MDGRIQMSQLNFSELFKASHEDNSLSNVNKSRFILSIGYYFFVMIILASFIFILFDHLGDTSMPSLKETMTPQMEVDRLFDSYENLVVILPNFIIDDFQSISTYPYNDDYFMIVDDAFDAFIYVDEVKTILPSYIILSLSDGSLDVATHVTFIPDDLISYDLINTINLENRVVFTSFTNSLINFIVYILLFPVIFLILLPYIFKDIQDAKMYQSKWLGLIIAGYLYVLAGNIFANVLTQLLYFVTGREETIAVNQAIILESLQGSGAFLMILSAVILGPIVEELIFRKAFFGVISDQKVAVIVSSFVFGLIHVLAEPTFLDLVINIIPYVVIGFVFGYIYTKHHKNLLIVTVVHMITNLISIVSILFFF